MSVEALAAATAAEYLRVHGSPIRGSYKGAHFKMPDTMTNAVASAKRWADAVELPSAAAVSAKMRADGGPTKSILLAEAWHDSQIVDVAHAIQAKQAATKHAKVPLSLVLIAGPSSSGKTTFCSKLSMHLRSSGIKPETLSTDDYFLARADPRHPRDKSGNLDFECIEAVDIEKLNTDLSRLFKGEAVETPVFDFVTGSVSRSTRRKSLPKGGVLIMEGIFCLNPALTPKVDRASKFNVFIAPMSPLKLKDGSDAREDYIRLIRRISRDFLHRGNSAIHTVRALLSCKSAHGSSQPNMISLQWSPRPPIAWDPAASGQEVCVGPQGRD